MAILTHPPSPSPPAPSLTPGPAPPGRGPRSRSTARPMSSARISDSPTRMAETPAASSRSTSAAGPDAALADESDPGRDLRSRSRKVRSRSVTNRRQVAVVDPDEVGTRVEDAGEVGLVVELDQGRHLPVPLARAWSRESHWRSSSRISAIRRTASAPPAGPRRPGIRRSGSLCGAAGWRPTPGSGRGTRGAPGSKVRR